MKLFFKKIPYRYQNMLTKKSLYPLFLACLSFLSPLQSNTRSVEARASYFYSTDARFRDIYSGAGLYSVEANFQVYKKPLIWTSLGFLYTSGTSIGESDDTRLFAIPLCLGVKYKFDWNRVHPYLGIGIASVPFSRIYNDSPYVTGNQYGWGIGGIAKSGLMFYKSERVYLNTFLDYTYIEMNYHHSNKVVIKRRGNLSGISAGIGLGFFF